MNSTRGQGMGINIVIIAAIALLILVIIAFLIVGSTGDIDDNLRSCTVQGGYCATSPEDSGHQRIDNANCPNDWDRCWSRVRS